MILVRFEAPHFVAGALFDAKGVCVRAAPIIAWMVGRNADDVRDYCADKGWRASILRLKQRQTKGQTNERCAHKTQPLPVLRSSV
jgi:hypothetical protein